MEAIAIIVAIIGILFGLIVLPIMFLFMFFSMIDIVLVIVTQKESNLSTRFLLKIRLKRLASLVNPDIKQ